MTNETSKYPYHWLEHYENPRDVYEVIEDELRYYSDAVDMSIMLKGLYGNSPIYNCLEQYAGLMETVNITTGRCSSETYQDEDFLLGGMLAVHANMKNLDKASRQYLVFNHVILGAISRSEKPDAIEEFERLALEDFRNLQNGDWFEYLQAQKPEFQQLITSTAEKLYADDREIAEHEMSFICGYMFASGMMRLTLEDESEVARFGSQLPVI